MGFLVTVCRAWKETTQQRCTLDKQRFGSPLQRGYRLTDIQEKRKAVHVTIIKNHAIMEYGGVGAQFHVLLTLY